MGGTAQDVGRVALVCALLCACLGTPDHASAWPTPLPEFPERAEPRFEASFHFENDNKLLGLWQIALPDGDDTGRTHGFTMRLAGVTRRGLRIDAEVATQLFTHQLYSSNGTRLNLREDGTLHPLRWKDRNIWFDDQNAARLLFSRALRHRPTLRLLGGVGLVVHNHRFIGPGGTGQQLWFHRFLDLFSYRTREFRYLPDGFGVYVGGRATAGVRYLDEWFAGRRVSLAFRADGWVELDTIAHGNHVFASTGVSLGLGRRRNRGQPRMHLGLSQDARLYVPSGAVMMDSRIDLWFHARRCDYLLSYDGYWGSLHPAYFHYAQNDGTTTVGMRCRTAE